MEYQLTSKEHANYTGLSLLFIKAVPKVPLIGLILLPVCPFCSSVPQKQLKTAVFKSSL